MAGKRVATPVVARLTWANVLASRLHQQHLVRRAPRRALLTALADISGVQAQVMSAAELALWARVDGFAAGDLDRLL